TPRSRVVIMMVEYVLSVDTELEALGFTNLVRFAHACVKAPQSRSFHDALPQRAPPSRKRILKKDLAGLGVCNGSKSARVPEVLRRRHTGALRIGDLC